MKSRTGFLIAFALLMATMVNAAGVLPADDKMSAMGKRAAAAVAKVNAARAARRPPARRQPTMTTIASTSRNAARRARKKKRKFPAARPSCRSRSMRAGQHIVIGFNDTRGFDKNPISVSGYLYSEDGGNTFVDGGQLPSPGNEAIGTTLFPQVFGDPEVKYLGNCVFVYASILIEKFSATTDVQTMGVHRSTDCGKTWEGPFEITSATNPERHRRRRRSRWTPPTRSSWTWIPTRAACW